MLIRKQCFDVYAKMWLAQANNGALREVGIFHWRTATYLQPYEGWIHDKRAVTRLDPHNDLEFYSSL